MIIDTSALIAILHEEADAELFVDALARAARCRISAGTMLEASIIADRSRDPIRSRAFDSIIAEARVEIEPVTAEHAAIARAAYRDFGRGSGHPARLNFGDCFAYALATVTREPLLYKGDDFGHTDVRSALDEQDDARHDT